MIRQNFAFALCLLLAGCAFNGGTNQIPGEKLGPGHCRQAGIVEFTIKAFHGPPNATLSIEIRNLKAEKLDRIENPGILDEKESEAAGYKIYQILSAGSDNNRGSLGAGENMTITFLLPTFPTPPWKEIAFDYNEGGKGPDGRGWAHPNTLYCSLVGDNAPWAFEAGP
ncbi:MAG: hypothetical protein LC623_08335 [Halobacteriales archaeon]|nr:hypothetical protein [Halobacteriales archaeon]